MESVSSGPPLTPPLPFPSTLLPSFPPDSNFVSQLNSLASTYPQIHRIRPDGSCFFRSLLLGICLHIRTDETERVRIHSYSQSTLKRLVELGYDEAALEIFYDEFMDLVGDGVKGKTEEEVLGILGGDGADYYTWWMRMVCVLELKSNSGFYEAFIEGYGSVAEFCSKEVEPAGCECENVQVMATVKAVGVRVVVNYVDGRTEGSNEHVFGEDGSTCEVCMLYRPGHYDLLRRG